MFVLPFYVIVLSIGLCIRAYLKRDSPSGRWRNLYLAVALLVYLGSIPVIPNWLVGKVEHTYGTPTIPADATAQTSILVLSGGWFRSTRDGYEIKLGQNSFERTVAAVELWRRIGGRLIFSGAPLPDGSDSVARQMAKLAVQMGVSDSQVAVEGLSRNTYENLAFCEQQFHLSQQRRVVLISSALHLVRGAAIARQLGIQVIPYPVDFRAHERSSWQMWIPSNDAAMALEEILHEIVGLLAYKVRGRA
ncbi:MAG: YdcF family protein [Rhodocyclales bacterium]|nr:YdcF family protein [Rhodocyclales bacterium]